MEVVVCGFQFVIFASETSESFDYRLINRDRLALDSGLDLIGFEGV